MNPLRTVTGLLTLPARTAGTVALAGLRTTSRVVGWAVAHATGTPERSPWSPPTQRTQPTAVPDTQDHQDAQDTRPTRASTGTSPADVAPAPTAPARKAPARKTPAGKTPARKTPARKTPARKAPSKKAAVIAPALGLSEDEVEDLTTRT